MFVIADTPDVRVEDQGTVVLFRVDTQAARDFMGECVLTERWQWLGRRAFAVDRRFADPLIEGMRDEGLTVHVEG